MCNLASNASFTKSVMTFECGKFYPFSLSYSAWVCKNGQKILERQVCDQVQDCEDGSGKKSCFKLNLGLVSLSIYLDEPTIACKGDNIPTAVLIFILTYVTIGIVIYVVVILTLNDKTEEKIDNFDMEVFNEKVS